MNAEITVFYALIASLCVTTSNARHLTPEKVCKSHVRFGNRTVTKCLHVNATDDSGECEIYKHATDEVSASWDVLLLFPDRDILLSETDDHQDELCEDLRKNFKIFEKHAKCVEAPQKQFVDGFVKGLRRIIKKRCTSKSWHEKYIKFSSCLKDHNINNAFHLCEDRLTAAYEFALNNITKENQTSSICCFAPMASECIHSQIGGACGKNITEFITHTLYSPVVKTFISLCKGQWEEQCDVELTNKFHKIFNQKHENKTRGLYQVFFDVIGNHPREDIKPDEHDSTTTVL